MLLKGAINPILYTGKFSILVNSQLVCLPPVNYQNKMKKLKIIEKKNKKNSKAELGRGMNSPCHFLLQKCKTQMAAGKCSVQPTYCKQQKSHPTPPLPFRTHLDPPLKMAFVAKASKDRPEPNPITNHKHTCINKTALYKPSLLQACSE